MGSAGPRVRLSAGETELDEALFPTGLDFLRLRFSEQWAQSDRRLTQIDNDGQTEDLENLAGAPFVAAVRKAHADYGRVLGITDKKAEPVDSTRVIEPLRALRAAVRDRAAGAKRRGAGRRSAM